VAGLVLDELGIPAVFDEVGDVGVPEGVQIQARGELKVITVSPESS
jgi:hypothetical protein